MVPALSLSACSPSTPSEAEDTIQSYLCVIRLDAGNLLNKIRHNKKWNHPASSEDTKSTDNGDLPKIVLMGGPPEIRKTEKCIGVELLSALEVLSIEIGTQLDRWPPE